MSDTEAGQNSGQSLRVVAQYLKDLSFENPGMGPLSRLRGTAPEISVNVNVEVSKIEGVEARYQVSVLLKAISKAKGSPLFILEATYTGIFEVTGFTDELTEQIVHIQCPALLFPFLRRIVGEKTVDGGFPPLYIDPIDFHSLYMQRKTEKEFGSGDKAPAKTPSDNPDDKGNTNENGDGAVKSVFGS